MNLKEWTGSKVVSVVMLTLTAAIVLALDAVVLFIGFGDGNIANLDQMDFAAIKGLFSSLVAGDVGKGLSIFSWVCVALAAICILGVIRRFCPYFFNSMKVVRGWMTYGQLKKVVRTEVFGEPIEFEDMLGGDFGAYWSAPLKTGQTTMMSAGSASSPRASCHWRRIMPPVVRSVSPLVSSVI